MLIRIYPYLLIFLALTTVGQWLSINWWAPNLTINFIEWCLCFYTLLYPTLKYKYIYKLRKNKAYRFFNLFFIYTIILSIYSLIKYSNQGKLADFANLAVFCMAMLSCVCVYTLSFPQWFNYTCKKLYRYLPIIAIIYMPFAKNQLFGDLMGFLCMPSLLLLCCFKILPRKQKYIWFCFALLIIISSYLGDARSNVIKYGFALIVGYTFFWDKFYTKFKNLIWIFFITPFIFLFLGITNVFNIFETDKYLDSQSFNESTISDTRTTVYEEVLTSAVTNNYIIWGRGIGKGYESNFQEWLTSSNNKSTTKINASERQAESGILNVFTWGGTIYIIIYTLFCISAVFYGIYRSNNRFCRNMAIYFAFYYMYSWIENFQSFSISFISSWFIVASCISPYFRNMTNIEFKEYLNKLLK